MFLSESLFYSFVEIWIGIAFLVFVINLKIKAPYGRHSKTTWGPMIDNKLAWFLMELPALLVCPILFFIGTGEKTHIASFLVLLWIIHYFNRTIIFPLRIQTKGKKMPIIIMIFAIFFNSINGFICGYYLGNFSYYASSWYYSYPFIIGFILFFAGFIINNQSDHVLIHLRNDKNKGYTIPKGKLFNYVSCPNLMGEIIEWLGFALMAFSLPILSFPIWTMCNLIPRALAHHKWYHDNFENYPKERKAVIPWVL